MELTTSGKTKMFLYPDRVQKIFPITYNIDLEVRALETIQSDYIIRMISHDEHSVTYERITPLRKIENADYDSLFTQLAHISMALFDIHSAGYVHGDVAIGNIGINNKGRYVLYDFETVKMDSSPEARYKDIAMFLEDFIVQYKSYPDLQAIIKEIYKRLQEKYLQITIGVRKSVFGKQKETQLFTYNYEVRGLGEIVISVYNELNLHGKAFKA